jgi:hypothetical protein
MTIDKQTALLEILHTEWRLLIASVNTLLLSIEKCQTIGEKADYNFEELESFDSLTSKFNRTSDIFTQKVLRTTWMLLHEPFAPYIDMVNKGEKIFLIKSADQMIEIRDLRNQIAHEYIPEAILELVPEVIVQTSLLIENIEECRHFLQSRGWI